MLNTWKVVKASTLEGRWKHYWHYQKELIMWSDDIKNNVFYKTEWKIKISEWWRKPLKLRAKTNRIIQSYEHDCINIEIFCLYILSFFATKKTHFRKLWIPTWNFRKKFEIFKFFDRYFYLQFFNLNSSGYQRFEFQNIEVSFSRIIQLSWIVVQPAE